MAGKEQQNSPPGQLKFTAELESKQSLDEEALYQKRAAWRIRFRQDSIVDT